MFGSQKTTWKKANNVLDEILQRYASDVPVELYFQLRLDEGGEVIRNRLGIPLISCCRGTSDVEAVHRQLRLVFRNWEIAVEMLDFLLAEFRLRYNHRISERKIPGFPQIGHFDTWHRFGPKPYCSESWCPHLPQLIKCL